MELGGFEVESRFFSLFLRKSLILLLTKRVTSCLERFVLRIISCLRGENRVSLSVFLFLIVGLSGFALSSCWLSGGAVGSLSVFRWLGGFRAGLRFESGFLPVFEKKS